MQAFFSYNDRIKTILEDTTMKVSVIQMNMRSLESKANFDRAEALVRRAVAENGPDVVVLPETWNTGFMPAGDLAAACDENAKAVRARFSPLARELNVNIVAGSVSNRRGGKIYKANGLVVGEFTCTEIDRVVRVGYMGSNAPLQYCVNAQPGNYTPAGKLYEDACLSVKQAEDYLCGRVEYGWHISDVQTYDRPKSLDCFALARAPQS